MLIEQIIEVQSRVPGLLVIHIPKSGYFHGKTKVFKGKSLSEWFNAKNVVESNVPWIPRPGQVTKFNPKMQDFKRVLNLTWSKKGICSIDFQISKILFFKVALKTCEVWSKWHLNGQFFPNS